jgi:nucleoside-diphosphate-sugar epimerase
MKTALVLGGGGFIGGHLAKRLKEDGFWVRIVDIKEKHEYFSHDEIKLYYDSLNPIIEGYLQSDI